MKRDNEDMADLMMHWMAKRSFEHYQDKWDRGFYVQALGHLDLAARMDTRWMERDA